jgi:hypothetical protein
VQDLEKDSRGQCFVSGSALDLHSIDRVKKRLTKCKENEAIRLDN